MSSFASNVNTRFNYINKKKSAAETLVRNHSIENIAKSYTSKFLIYPKEIIDRLLGGRIANYLPESGRQVTKLYLTAR